MTAVPADVYALVFFILIYGFYSDSWTYERQLSRVSQLLLVLNIIFVLVQITILFKVTYTVIIVLLIVQFLKEFPKLLALMSTLNILNYQDLKLTRRGWNF